jgi:hypothetical protein
MNGGLRRPTATIRCYLWPRTEVPNTISEYAYAGARVDEKLKVVKGEVSGLAMPAGAEIVVQDGYAPNACCKRIPLVSDRLLLGIAAAGSDDGHQAAVFP